MSHLFVRLFAKLVNLHASFYNRFGVGKNLIHYLAMPKIDHNGFNFEESLKILIDRQHPDRLDAVKAAPQDILIFKKRANLLASNNEAYRIAMSYNPTIAELMEFSYMAPGWAVLFPLKAALMHHYEEWEAAKFKGFLPYGSAVIAFVNALDLDHKKIGASPDFADHVYLQEISNREALLGNISSIEINNLMYLAGLELVNSPNPSALVA